MRPYITCHGKCKYAIKKVKSKSLLITRSIHINELRNVGNNRVQKVSSVKTYIKKLEEQRGRNIRIKVSCIKAKTNKQKKGIK